MLALLGDRLGLYKAMAGAGPLTPRRAGRADAARAERYVREWLNNQAAGGIVDYDPATATFMLPPEQAMIYADESSPAYLGGGFDLLESLLERRAALPATRSAAGDGVAWGDHHPSMFCGTERFFRTGYQTHLAAEWIPALDGVVAKLERGGRVADLGCGHGVSSMVIAEAFRTRVVVGSDVHAPSIEHAARGRPRRAGLRTG